MSNPKRICPSCGRSLKQIFTAILALTMVFSLAACGSPSAVKTTAETKADDSEGEIVGGWEIVQTDELQDADVEVLNKALEMIDAVWTPCEPIRLLATQTVSGTNYAFLCRKTEVSADTQSSPFIVYVYADLEGSAEVMRVQNLIASAEEDATGGWSAEVTDEISTSAKAALEKAVEEMTGADYEMVSLLATQVVAGTNYQLLCKVTPVVPGATDTYSLVTVYEDAESNAEITAVEDLEFSLYEND